MLTILSPFKADIDGVKRQTESNIFSTVGFSTSFSFPHHTCLPLSSLTASSTSGKAISSDRVASRVGAQQQRPGAGASSSQRTPSLDFSSSPRRSPALQQRPSPGVQNSKVVVATTGGSSSGSGSAKGKTARAAVGRSSRGGGVSDGKSDKVDEQALKGWLQSLKLSKVCFATKKG